MSILNFLANQPESSLIKVPKNTLISEEGQACEQLVVLVSGRVKVFKTSAEGRTISLYTIEPGESCILTASAIMNNVPFSAQ